MRARPTPDCSLSASAVNSPYASLTDGGNYAGATVNLADGLNVRTGYSWMTPDGQQPCRSLPTSWRTYAMHNQTGAFDQRTANAAVMSMSWRIADWGGLGVVASQTDEHNGVLGGSGSGALNLARSADTSAVDATMRIGLGQDWIATVAYGEGLTRLNVLARRTARTRPAALRSRSYGIALATRDCLRATTRWASL